MEITTLWGGTGYQTYLHLALHEAISEYMRLRTELQRHPPLTEDTANPSLVLLYHEVEQHRAVAIVLAGCCVEAGANFYLALKATPEQFAVLERASIVHFELSKLAHMEHRVRDFTIYSCQVQTWTEFNVPRQRRFALRKIGTVT